MVQLIISGHGDQVSIVCCGLSLQILVPMLTREGIAAIVGHAHEEVKAALHAQIEKGTSFGAPCAMEVNAVLDFAAITDSD